MRKRILAVFLAALTLLSASVLSGCGGGSSGEDAATSYTYWVGNGADSYYYDTYEDNPAVQYLLQQTYGPENKSVSLRFTIPPTGTQQDNFNNLISTMELCDIMDMSFASQTAQELYDNGVAMELTEYITPEYMPNYCAFLEAHPELAKTAGVRDENGELHYYQLYAYNDGPQPMFQGLLYRRDWIVNYGEMPDHIWTDSAKKPTYPSYAQAQQNNDWTGWMENPAAGTAFSGGYGTPGDDASWTDNVIFPSGTAEPLYISDWEWMFEIFSKAMASQGITDGYCHSIFYMGVNGLGDFFSGFGGGSLLFYQEDGIVKTGGDSETMRAYLECMRTWYNNGWLDKSFSEHTSDMFYAIDSDKVHSGKVGIWAGRQSEIGSQMDLKDGGFTEGICAKAAPWPINDMYGDENCQMKEPNTLYQFSLEANGFIITTAAESKDIPTLLAFIDYLYSTEGGVIVSRGLTEEQIAQVPDKSFYEKFNLDYCVFQNSDGLYDVVDALKADGLLMNAGAAMRLPGLTIQTSGGKIASLLAPSVQEATDVWARYADRCTIPNSVTAQLTPEQSNRYNKLVSNLNTYYSTELVKFIKGENDLEGDWDTYCKMIEKYGTYIVLEDFQGIYDRIG